LEDSDRRLSFINIARGFANFFVVLLHTFVPEIRGNSPAVLTAFFWMNAFTFQLFMVISGYLYERGYGKYRAKGYAGFFRGKLQTVILPYVSVSALSYVGIGLAFLAPPLARVLQTGGYAPFRIFDAALQIITYEGHIINHLWFLPTLFLIFALTYITGRFFAGLPGLLISVALSLLSYHIVMPALVYRVCAMFVFFNIGRRIAFVDAFSQTKRLAVMLVVFIGAFAADRAGLLDRSRSLQAISAIVIGTSGAMVFIAISRIVEGKALGRGLSWIGDNSFAIYLLHQPFIVSGISGILLMFTALPHLVICAITLALGILLPSLLNRFVISRIRLLRGLLLGDFSANETQVEKRNG